MRFYSTLGFLFASTFAQACPPAAAFVSSCHQQAAQVSYAVQPVLSAALVTAYVPTLSLPVAAQQIQYQQVPVQAQAQIQYQQAPMVQQQVLPPQQAAVYAVPQMSYAVQPAVSYSAQVLAPAASVKVQRQVLVQRQAVAVHAPVRALAVGRMGILGRLRARIAANRVARLGVGSTVIVR